MRYYQINQYIHIMEVLEGEEKDKGASCLFKEMLAEKNHKFGKGNEHPYSKFKRPQIYRTWRGLHKDTL